MLKSRRLFLASTLCWMYTAAAYSFSGKNNHFKVSMHGDLDDDLIIAKATPADVKIEDIISK